MKRIHLVILTGFIASSIISSCKVGQNYQRPSVQLPEKFETTAFADTSSIADLEWNKFFTDTTLRNLIERGIKYNYDLQIAMKNIDVAQQRLKEAKLLQLPEVNLQVSAQYNRPSKNSLSGLSSSGFLGSNHIETYNANLGLSWEADIWGKIRRQKEASVAAYLQTYEATKAVQTSLVADIAQGYFNLLMLDKQLRITRQNLRLNDTTLRLTQLLKDAGEVTLLAVQQADAQRQTTTLLIPRLEQQIAIQENVLQVLTGQLPGNLTRSSTLDNTTVEETSTTGLPAALISRRPDVRANEMALMSANAQVGIAQAYMYPSLVLSASGGVESLKASNWFSVPASLFGIANGSVFQPLFNHRALKTQFEVEKVQRDQAVAQFRQSVLNAVMEVDNALVQTDKLEQQRELANSQVETLRKAVKNAQLLFKSDMANYLEVITAQRNALLSELDLASIQRDQLDAKIELYRSLGGGWK
ncbi:efflux transporter outer membrane subunit [Pedobacter sp. HMF7647]|uniref:Efflux transporter outer membrane subunit n=1 Tax=Hufsiella arboris TaxID=2695275 RepID=A0A7K1YB58_9SPHI|nr:efflux transporter outer membrane subunit [Hufsiella arboris]MXV51288.1 efflux transporter outer membrane subunit [Hufsiella arboris]